MIERLDRDTLIEFNRVLCSDTGEPHELLDPDGLDGAVERPFSGFGEHETFPTIYEKAAALLHGIAARQVFKNGNKRTAWAAAATFLEVNGVVLREVETVQGDMFVRAAALDHTLEVSALAEWFVVSEARASDRLVHLEIAEDVVNLAPAVFSIGRVGHNDIECDEPSDQAPVVYPASLITRWQFLPQDAGETMSVAVVVDGWPAGSRSPFVLASAAPLEGTVSPGHYLVATEGAPPTPQVLIFDFALVATSHGVGAIVVLLDGEEAGRFNVTIGPRIRPPSDSDLERLGP